MMIRRCFALAIALVILLALCSCDLSEEDATQAPSEGSEEMTEYTDMPESGEGTGIGSHDDENGYHIVNKAEFVHPDGYTANHVAHSYDALDKTYQNVYTKMLDAVYCFSDKTGFYDNEYKMRPLLIDGTDYTRKDIEATLVAVIDDHPEIFWMSSNVDLEMDYEASVTNVMMNSWYKADEVVNKMKELDAAFGEFYDELPSSMSAYESEVYVYEYIIDNCVYDEDVGSSDDYDSQHPSIYNIYGVMLDKKAVCEGYSRTFDYLCGELGVDAVCICGTALDEDGKVAEDGGLHMWNAAVIDGDWYMVDATWDDWDDAEDLGNAFTYLNITDEVLSYDHITDKTYADITEEEYGKLDTYINSFVPDKCTATEYCYYQREGITMSSPDDVDALTDGFVESAEDERKSLMVNIDTDEYTAEQFGDALFEGKQPYYEAIDNANRKLGEMKLDIEADAVYYSYDERNLLILEMNYQ